MTASAWPYLLHNDYEPKTKWKGTSILTVGQNVYTSDFEYTSDFDLEGISSFNRFFFMGLIFNALEIFYFLITSEA